MKKFFFAAEDDEMMCSLYQMAFEIAGCEIEIARDGEEALSRLKTMEIKPRVSILDIMMPKMNGLDVLEKMKKDPLLKEIPVILLTNLTGDENFEKGMSLGAAAYMIKSDYNPNKIVERVIAIANEGGQGTIVENLNQMG
jgi:DNA-binding response OmpR family regulator